MPVVPLPARIVVTWLAIFPLAALVQTLLHPLTADWPPLLATAATLTLVVPNALIWAVPLLTKLYLRAFARA
ncbi:hypothetical protein [Nocardioides insulae]|uniref:hypothetical protein n=1 Tax=Nocardioides insulae TaxID=394734 RepID=UPI000686A697|nr:hypothetical protein [Nocardioides insulae]